MRRRDALLLILASIILASSLAFTTGTRVDRCIDARAALRAGHFARAAELAAAASAAAGDSTSTSVAADTADCVALRGIALMRAQRIDEGAKVLDALVASMRRQQQHARPCRVAADYLGAAYELVARRLSTVAASAMAPTLAARAMQQFNCARNGRRRLPDGRCV